MVEFAGARKRKACWVCRCDCGNVVVVRSCDMQSGNTQSCGCLRQEKSSNAIRMLNTKQGANNRTKRRLYLTWQSMRRRCSDPNHGAYLCYGGRGIKVCLEWENDYWAFERWAMLNGWHEGLTLDRIDNDKGYSPDNCRWATSKVQNNNQRRNVVLEYQGKRQTLTQWAEELGILVTTLYRRYERGWSVERMLTEPVHKRK